MTADTTQTDVPKTASGIPIRNVWHMLMYAWNELQDLSRWKAEIESAPTLDALLATILSGLLMQRLRIGLGCQYRKEEGRIRGIRGQIDFTKSLNRLAFQNGQAHCHFYAHLPNVPMNQIVRSTLADLSIFGNFERDATRLRHELRSIVRQFDNIDLIELKPSIVRREQLMRHDPDYRLMLSICYLVALRRMPTESSGTEVSPGLDRDLLTMHKVFEVFVANFYKSRLQGWSVKPQATWKWPATGDCQFLPTLKPDLVLHHKASGQITILDTKFTAKCLTAGQWGNETFDRNHVFQIYGYLRSQEHRSVHYQASTGVLLYPTVGRRISEGVYLHGHNVRWESIDLSTTWNQVESDLLTLITEFTPPSFTHPTAQDV